MEQNAILLRVSNTGDSLLHRSGSPEVPPGTRVDRVVWAPFFVLPKRCQREGCHPPKNRVGPILGFSIMGPGGCLTLRGVGGGGLGWWRFGWGCGAGPRPK